MPLSTHPFFKIFSINHYHNLNQVPLVIVTFIIDIDIITQATTRYRYRTQVLPYLVVLFSHRFYIFFIFMAGDMSDLQNSPSISSSAQQLQPSQPQNVQSLELPNHDSADAQYEIEWVMKSFKCAQKLRQDNFFKARSIRVDEFHKDEARRRQAYFAAEQIRLKQFQEAQTLKRKLFEDVEYNKELEETRYFTTICQVCNL